ncbi:heterokaryon incompatibility protein-domain-containing protein [Tricladium varicosporioides]|nr:heterokaryon incompatibility protein-domain-containing protein [Hymenoscyphus varicosporioides]
MSTAAVEQLAPRTNVPALNNLGGAEGDEGIFSLEVPQRVNKSYGDDDFQSQLSHLPYEVRPDQIGDKGNNPRMWHEVHPNARYLSSREFKSGKQIGQRPKQQLYGNHQVHQLQATPYVEKEIWKPDKPARANVNEYIDINTIRNWINVCENLHETCCGRLDVQSHGAAQPLFLIDVDNLKLVPSAPGIKYVALSYVWGQEKTDESPGLAVCMNSRNLPELLEDNSLVSSKVFVAPVVRHAMDLVRSLNGKFLWVDKFCIPQDNGPDKQSQLIAMPSIYGNAWLTIIAAQDLELNQGPYGDRKVNQGLYGDRPLVDSAMEEPKIDIRKPESDFGDTREHLTNQQVVNYNARALMCSLWFSRGWTFQEYLCSGRRLFFHDNIIGWECKVSSWHESQDISGMIQAPTPLTSVASTGLQNLMDCPWPDFYSYARFICMYNRRALTYPEDAFDGFGGILSQLARPYIGMNVSGLPEMFFNAALLWQPWMPMGRRKAKRCDQEDACLPSWSWIGWSGDVHTESWALAYSYLKPVLKRGIDPNKPLPWKITKTVNWYYSQSLNSERRKITDSSLEYQLSGDETLQQDGWTVQKNYSEWADWRHRSDPTRRFWYPIPIVEKSQLNRQDLTVTARFIHGKTRRAFFKLGSKFVRHSASGCMVVDLINPVNSTWAGFLRLNLFFSDDFPLASSLDQCELVELSAGSFEAGMSGKYLLDEWRRLIPSIQHRDYKFYNVLCIKWKKLRDGTAAYRRALGRIEKSQWDSLATEFDITLA